MIKAIDISGSWQLALDKNCSGVQPDYSDSITLPNTTSNACKGEYNQSVKQVSLQIPINLRALHGSEKLSSFPKLKTKR